jgi:GDP-L-fucose synthase
MRIYVAGHRGLVGSALVREIEKHPEHTWIGKSRAELDLLDRKAVFDFLASEKPDAVIIAAAKVGGIMANSTYPVEFLSENLQIETNLIDGAHAAEIDKLLFLGSSCIYPKLAPQPIKEEYLLTGPLEASNEPYALAKISGLKLVQAYRKEYGRQWVSAMPSNVFGPGDNFDEKTSHVLPALIGKFHTAMKAGSKSVTVWGSGTPKREFMYSEDLAGACIFLLEKYNDDSHINVGTGTDLSISELAQTIAKVVGFEGEIHFDASKPDGTPRKLLDVSKLSALGWQSNILFKEGIQKTYDWFLENEAQY